MSIASLRRGQRDRLVPVAEGDRPRLALLAADDRHRVRLACRGDVELAVVRHVPDGDDLVALVGRLAVVDELAVVGADAGEEGAEARERGERPEPAVRRRGLEPLAVQELRDPGAREVLVELVAAADVERVADPDEVELQAVRRHRALRALAASRGQVERDRRSVRLDAPRDVRRARARRGGVRVGEHADGPASTPRRSASRSCRCRRSPRGARPSGRGRGPRRASWARVFQIRSPNEDAGDAELGPSLGARGRGSRRRARHLRAPLRRAARAAHARRGAGRRGGVHPRRREPARAARARSARTRLSAVSSRSAAPGCTTSRTRSRTSAPRSRISAEAGAELIDETPRRGMFGLEVAFVHPDSVHGVLSEVVCAHD